VAGNRDLAEKLADLMHLRALVAGEQLIEQGDSDNDVFMILAGAFDIIVNGRIVGRRIANDHVGEMAAIEPAQRRSASVVASEDSVVAMITEPQLTEIAGIYPEIYRQIARELSRRLMQRNAQVNATRERIHVFIISSAEALHVARTIQNAFAFDPFTTTVWTDGVFKATNYTLQSLEDAIDSSDFAIAIAHADDMTVYRGSEWPTPRDNVIFELGLFMGRLGKHRAILMEPREENIKLPSDLAGITTIPYRFQKGADESALLGPACNLLRAHILSLGPNN
ncbi:MAG TPA: TIR domain-containing protein, partial [Saprospiraceae bacterium]|nr:TIR domain-containing protein [Saprospiraceae bacterium]